MSYRRVAAPKEYEPGWLDQELEKLEKVLLGTDSFRLKEWNVEPPKPRLGDIYLADGTNWDPGSGQGAYLFTGSGFVLLGFDGTLAPGSVGATELASDAVTTAKILDDNVTFAKLQNIATQRAIGRNTAGTGDPEEVTVQQILNWIASSTRGDILRRGAANWERFALGAADTVLSSNGTDPVWAELGAPGLALLDSGSVSNAATLDIVLTSYTSYRVLKFILTAFLPQTDGVELWVRFSTNGGSSYDAGANNYSWGRIHEDGASNVVGVADTSDTEISIANSVGSAATDGVDAIIELFDPTSTTRVTRIQSDCVAPNGSSSANRRFTGSGFRLTAQNTDAIRFMFSVNNIVSGNWAVYGYA